MKPSLEDIVEQIDQRIQVQKMIMLDASPEVCEKRTGIIHELSRIRDYIIGGGGTDEQDHNFPII